MRCELMILNIFLIIYIKLTINSNQTEMFNFPNQTKITSNMVLALLGESLFNS